MSINIAIADDHQLVRKGVVLLLENIPGFKVIIEASDGRELIDKIEGAGNLPDLVLVDVNMPVLNGLEAVGELREKYPDLRVVALSVNDELPVIRELIEAGANAYMVKDSSPETFKKVLIEVNEKGYYYSKAVIESLLIRNGRSLHGRQEQLNRMLGQLTPREEEFIVNCCSELTYKEIADKMHVSQRTVDGYRESTFDKLNIRSRTGLVMFAYDSGLIEKQESRH